ncbi:MAG TPA: SNF2-related protein, partial [Verrucomicrobiae bacterium]|nr:SNF2-related protein [Verrucomicrobiae bacterium]
LPLLVDHPGVSLGRKTDLKITSEPMRVPLKAVLEPTGEIVLSLKQKASGMTRVGKWAWNGNMVQPLPVGDLPGDIFSGPVRIPRTQVPQFLGRQWPALSASGALEANFQIEDFQLEPQPPKFLLALQGGLSQLSALLQCAYGSRIMTLGVTASEESVWLPDPASPTRYSTRDISAEKKALARLQRCGFIGPDENGKLRLAGQNAVLNFFAREYPKLEREWKVALEEKLENGTMRKLDRIQPQFHISSGVQWFDLGVVFSSTGGETFPAAEIQRLLRSGQTHARLKNGKLALIDTGAVEELQEVLLDASPEQREGKYRIGSAQAGFLDATLREHPQWRVSAPASWSERAARQRGDTALECPPLGELETVLRPYQKRGVAWLKFLRENGFGGILADEMGLGKTLQTLAFLDAQPKSSAAARKPHLIVCPTSLVFNWVSEAAKFTPKLKVLALHGPERHARFETIAEHDAVVTSYALIRRDAERYRGLEFDTLILDEAQHIKNRQTQNAQAVKSIRADHRVVLTGTPMENSVLDLWSIFDFLMPGYLGSAQDFRERYEIPITKEKNAEAQSRLAKRLRPFLLRRLKREVAADLPAKLEQVSFCELTPQQRTVYQQLIEASRKEILEASSEQEKARSRMMMLTALMRLRQACCDLRLLKLEGAEAGSASGKLELFAELLEEVIDGGHRVLVFSQFVSMLSLLKERLAAEEIEYCYLDGSTPDRGAVVERFQSNAGIPVFLISLKAGGTGLNLTGADTVIHFDPWWNPAVEDQAT